jgi:glycosyltransferase involved in cell wall biosynthesis
MKTTAPVFLPTIEERLLTCNNDYSSVEAMFQAGPHLPLVDLRTSGLIDVTSNEGDRTRQAYISTFLRAGEDTPSVSAIIPVHGGAEALSECIFSFARQSFVIERPDHIELIIVEDGVEEKSSSVFDHNEVDKALKQLSQMGVALTLLRLKTNQGRAQARNAGIGNAAGDVLLLVDGSMVLDRDFIVEQIWRHARLRANIALLGFKQNISLEDFKKYKVAIVDGDLRPDYRLDLKWHHILSAAEVGADGFRYGKKTFRAGEAINYMELTRALKKLRGRSHIGNRTLPTFFQTNIVSASRKSVIDVGGFDPRMQLWGLEDTFLGALLVSTGSFLVPCPSSTAFNLELGEAENTNKEFDLALNRSKYQELLKKTRANEYTETKFKEALALLKPKTEVVIRSYLKPSRFQKAVNLGTITPERQSVGPALEERTELKVVALSTILEWGWDSDRLVEEITGLDYATMEGLTQSAAGTPIQWRAIFEDHPDSWRILSTATPSVVGYWHFVALFKDDFQRALEGQLLDKDIAADRVQSFELPGVYNIYFAGLAIHPSQRSHLSLNALVSSFFEVLQSLANNGIFFEKLCANAFTSYGRSICETLNFTRAGSGVSGGHIYATTIIRLLERPLAARYAKLLDMYRHRLKESS